MQDKDKAPTPSNNNGNEQPEPSQATSQSANQPEQQLSVEQATRQVGEKIKQNKLLEAKNKKLQGKYIELFKEQKLLKKDWGVFTTLVKEVLPDFEDKPVGKYDLEELRELWNRKEGSLLSRIQELQAGMDKFREKVQRESNELAQEKVDRAIRESKEKVDAVNKQLESFKKNSKNLGDQLADYDKKLQAKSDQVSKLTKQKLKLEHTINQMKMKSITDELSDNKTEDKINTERNQILSLRHQVSELMHKRDDMRVELKNAKGTIDKLKALLEDKNKEIDALRQEKGGEKSDNKNGENGRRETQREPPVEKKISMSSNSENESQRHQEEQEHHMLGDDEYIHREYMKNVFIRYMKSWAKGDQAQTEILLNIILTMLKFDGKERDLIGEKKKNWWALY